MVHPRGGPGRPPFPAPTEATVRAETQTMVDEIQQAMALLRRHL
jgi:hypothetical protein